jgi:hypothetical protein
VCLVRFYLCWLKPTSNSCTNSVLRYECSHVRIGGKKYRSNLVHLILPKSEQRPSISNVNINRRHVFWTLTRHDSNGILFNRMLHCCAGFPIILLNFVLHLPLYTSLQIPNFTSSYMEPTASQVRNHYLQKNQEAHLERALPPALQKTAILHCQSNI